MEYRVIKPIESGTSRAGLVGLVSPNKESAAESDSHLLIMVRQPHLGVDAFHVHHGRIERVIAPEEYVSLPQMQRPEPVAPSVRRWRLAGYAALIVLLAILTTFGIAGVTGVVSLRVVLTGSMVPTINPGDLKSGHALVRKGKQGVLVLVLK
jgi:hypothetical protein